MTITSAPSTYKLSAGEGLADLWWKTGRVAVKATGDQTGGRLSQVEIDDPLGTAPPLHIHHDADETFSVLEGTVTVFAGDEQIELGPGDYGFVPRGAAHAYLVTSERARMLVTFSPAGFEQVFLAFGEPADGGPVPEDAVMPAPDEFARLLAPYGCEIVGPPPTLAG
jgi:quercetin dioxygenase-like cupin family protein